MSMKKITKKMLAIVAAAAMTMGMAMPAMAAEGATAPDTINNAKEAYISKTYQTEVNKPMEFKFEATQVVESTREDLVKNNLTCTIPSIKFESTDLNVGEGTYTKLSEKITFGAFTEAGKYEYTVKESATTVPTVTDSAYEKLIMSKAEYTMDVYVVEDNDGNFNIEKIIVTKTKNDDGTDADGGKVDIGGDDAGKNGFNFVNTYVQEAGTGTPDPTKPDPDYTKYGALNVSKKVIQNVTDTAELPTKKFDFTANFEFPAGTDAATLGGVKGNGSDVTLKNGQCTFQLGHNENMKFTGLPVGTKITVTEAAKANYKGSAKVTINGVEQTAITATKYNEEIKNNHPKKKMEYDTWDFRYHNDDHSIISCIINAI